MRSFVANAIANVLRPTVKSVAGVDIVYKSHHTGDTYSIRATKDSSRADAEDHDGFMMSYRVRDFKIDILDLPVMPQRLDTIIETDENGVEQYYQVLIDSSQRAVEPGDNFTTYWRVHCKMIPEPTQTQVMYGNAGGVAYGNADTDGVAYGNSPRR